MEPSKGSDLGRRVEWRERGARRQVAAWGGPVTRVPWGTGEAPGADEDQRGEPFVGRAGELLTRMIAGMDEKKLIPGVPLSRETVYIVNVLKCRPPENRNPMPHEIEACSPYLMRQLEALQPRIICCLGKFAAELLLQLKGTVTSMRGRTYRFFEGQPLYAFGHGLSYTTFAYENLRLSSPSVAADGAITLSADVRNTGSRAGDEVVQFYVQHIGSAVSRPLKELKGYTRIALRPGERKTVSFALPARFSFNPFAKHPIVEDLIVRVDRARRRTD